MRTRFVIVGKVRLQQPMPVLLVEDDHRVQTLAAYRADQVFVVGILPGRTRGRDALLKAPAPHPAAEFFTVDAVLIPQQESPRRATIFGSVGPNTVNPPMHRPVN
jgi:hypothetical protein